MDTNHSPNSKAYRQFIKDMEAMMMTPQQRTTYNQVIRQYEAMMKIDYKTQDRYEAEIAKMRRQIDKLEGELAIAKKVIHQGEDDETPMPVLHMMERCAKAEEHADELHRRILLACVDSPDVYAIAELAHERHKASGVKEDDLMSASAIYDELQEDLIQQGDLMTTEAHYDVLEEEKEAAYDDGHSAGCEYQEEECNGQFNDRLEQLFKEHMSRTAPWETADIGWYEMAEQIASRMEHYILAHEEEQKNCQLAEEKNEELKGKFRKDLNEMAEAMTIPLKKELAEAQKEKAVAVLEGEFNLWREQQAYQQDIYQEGAFLLDYAPCKEMAREVFNDLNSDCLNDYCWQMNDKYEVVQMYPDDDGEYTLTEEEWEKTK